MATTRHEPESRTPSQRSRHGAHPRHCALAQLRTTFWPLPARYEPWLSAAGPRGGRCLSGGALGQRRRSCCDCSLQLGSAQHILDVGPQLRPPLPARCDCPRGHRHRHRRPRRRRRPRWSSVPRRPESRARLPMPAEPEPAEPERQLHGQQLAPGQRPAPGPPPALGPPALGPPPAPGPPVLGPPRAPGPRPAGPAPLGSPPRLGNPPRSGNPRRSRTR